MAQKGKRDAPLTTPSETSNRARGLLGDLLQLGLPLDYYDTYVSRVSAVSIANVNACAKVLLDPRQMIWMVVADHSQVEPGLRDLGIGDIIPAEA